MENQAQAVIARLESMASPENAAGMARFGIKGGRVLGISVKTLRALAREFGRNHPLALELWASGIHEARILATILDDPRQVTEEQMESWVADFDSWDMCDQACGNLFDKTPYAYTKAMVWSRRPEEFVRRAGFALMAYLALHDKQAADEVFEPFFVCIREQAMDERNYVKKAVNWALRQIGKRNPVLGTRAFDVAREIEGMDSKAARWIAKVAIKELSDRR